jgi:succinate-semialdehyde dehydrogenase/glutarate-semialdehyde dehydrogenase
MWITQGSAGVALRQRRPAMRVINPATEEVIGEYEFHSPAQIEASLAGAARAFPTWRDTPIADRGRLMHRTAAVLRERASSLATLMAREMGKPVTAGEAEVEKCATTCGFFADNAEHFLADEPIESDATRSYVRYEPLGAVFAIMPWNFPFWQVFRFAAPTLMAGNVGVLKHAPNVPGCAAAIEDIFRAAGFPPGVFTNVYADNDQAAAIIRHPVIRAVTLTGSTRAGRAVAAEAGRALKKVVLELGGSDPFIVIPPKDGAGDFLHEMADRAAQARCINSGQSCIAAKRFIIVGGWTDMFEQRMAGTMAAMKVGDPRERDTEIGPLARLDLLENLHDQVQRSVAAGAYVVTGGRRLDRKGYFYAPTVLSDVTREMPAFAEETFGPVAAVIGARDVDEAVDLANATPYGLGSSIWTPDVALAERIAPRIESGNVFINGIVKSDARLPFGGVKDSGHGRELSAAGIREFVNVKTVWVKDADQDPAR